MSRKFILRGALFILMMALLDYSLFRVFQYFYFKSPYGDIRDINYIMKESDDQLITMGSSKARHHFVSELLEDSLHLKTFNAGMDGMAIYYHFVVLNGIIQHHIPKGIVLDISLKDLTDAEEDRFETVNILSPYYGKVAALDSIVALQGFSEVMKMQSGLYRYNSKIAQIISCYTIPYTIDRGYKPLNGIWKKGIERLEEVEYSFDSSKLMFFQEYIDLCKSKCISLFVTVSPVYSIQTGAIDVYRKLENILKKNQVPYLILNQSEMFLKHPEWFDDPAHLNNEGAQVFSQEVVRFIKKEEKFN